MKTLHSTLAILFLYANFSMAGMFDCDWNIGRIINGPKVEVRQVKANELAALISIDKETQEMIQNPLIAQYMYLNFFADKVGDKEIKLTLQDIVDSASAKDKNLFALFNDKLAQKLNDPEIKDQVKQIVTKDEDALRPSPLRARFANLKAAMRHVKGFFTTISRLRTNIKNGMSKKVMDRGLFDFYGATQLGLPESQLRKWDGTSGGISEIRPGQIENISPELWSQIAQFASETEAPIMEYSLESGDTLRALLPALSRFMGKTREERMAYDLKTAEGHNITYCTNVWCTEENRHDNAIQSIAEQITGIKKADGQTYEGGEEITDPTDIEYALKHIVARNASEWNANSVYFFLGSHAHGPAKTWVDNIRQDETKHMAVLNGAYKYFYGDQLFSRTKRMIQIIKSYADLHSETNSNADLLSLKRPLTLIEFAATHLYVEKQVRQFIESIPLKTVVKLFDSPVKTIQDIDAVPIDPAKKQTLDEIAVTQKKLRDMLKRWAPKQRQQYLKLKEVEVKYAQEIEGLVKGLFRSFDGADVGTEAEARVLKGIDTLVTGLDKDTNEVIKLSLKESLRDYQIMNNEFVRSRRDLYVYFKNASEGFHVRRLADDEVRLLRTEMITSDHFMFRVEKPPGLTPKSGQAFHITISNADGDNSRMLSLSSDPNQDYLEFAVGVSESKFKQALVASKKGAILKVKDTQVRMNFDETKPAVMIAGGIGITPFKSFIDESFTLNSQQKMHLVYGNRTDIPYEDELDKLAFENDRFSVTHTLTKPLAGWDGQKGRISPQMLEAMKNQFPLNANYYIVGNPAMIKQTQEALENIGIAPEKIQIEAFTDTSTMQKDLSTHVDNNQIRNKGTKEKDEVVCLCHSVTAGALELAINAGADTMEKLSNETMAGTGCGNCKCKMGQMLQCAVKAKK